MIDLVFYCSLYFIFANVIISAIVSLACAWCYGDIIRGKKSRGEHPVMNAFLSFYITIVGLSFFLVCISGIIKIFI